MSVPVSALINLQNGTTADATQVMANFNALVTAFGVAAAAGVNNDITQLTGITTPLLPAAGGSTVYTAPLASAGINTITISSTVPSNFTLAAGNGIVFKAGNSNTGPATLQVNATAATPIQRRTAAGLLPLVGGEIVTGEVHVAVYDGAVFQLTTGAPVAPSYFVGMSAAGTNAITVASTFPSDYSLTAAQLPALVFKATGTNTGPVTVQTTTPVTSATPVVKRTSAGLAALTGNEIVTGEVIAVVYDGTQYQLMNNTVPSVPTRQTFTAGTSLTYTTPVGCRQLRVRMCGGGGGGGASGNTGSGSGGSGGNTVFDSATANGGSGGGSSGSAAGTGGTGGAGSATLRIAGGCGARGIGLSTTGFTIQIAGGRGGTNPFGGQGNDLQAPAANTGCGGDGCFYGSSTVASSAGSGGGAGEYVEQIINNPSATYTYTVGAGGTGANAAAAGAAGIIIVEEIY